MTFLWFIIPITMKAKKINIDTKFFKTKNIYEFIFNTIITYFQAINTRFLKFRPPHSNIKDRGKQWNAKWEINSWTMNLGNYNTYHLFHEIAHVQPRKISFLVLFDFIIRSNAEEWNTEKFYQIQFLFSRKFNELKINFHFILIISCFLIYVSFLFHSFIIYILIISKLLKNLRCLLGNFCWILCFFKEFFRRNRGINIRKNCRQLSIHGGLIIYAKFSFECTETYQMATKGSLCNHSTCIVNWCIVEMAHAQNIHHVSVSTTLTFALHVAGKLRYRCEFCAILLWESGARMNSSWHLETYKGKWHGVIGTLINPSLHFYIFRINFYKMFDLACLNYIQDSQRFLRLFIK